MGSLITALVLLWQSWALQGATALSVHQEPKLLQVKQDSQVTLTCQVVLSQACEQLRVEWTKDSVTLCPPYITNGTLSLGVCGPQGRLSWQPPGNLTLQLDHVSLNDSGNYVCWATMEIPELAEAKGNGTQLLVETGGPPPNLNQILGSPGFLFALLVAGGAAVAAVVLGAWLWGRRRCRHKDTGNAIYSNVLYKPRGAPKKTEAWPVEGKALDVPTDNQKHQSFYAISLPQPPTPQRRPAPKSCPSPRPGHPISTVRTSPCSGSSEWPRPRGFLEVARGVKTPETQRGVAM